MKQRVSLSTYSVVATLIVVAAMIFMVFFLKEPSRAILYAIVLVVGCLLALFYMPRSISVDDRELHINRSLRIKSIPLSEIASIDLYEIPWDAQRVFNSEGIFGYWGKLYTPQTGWCFTYTGKRADCFLVTLKNGKKYILGCKNPRQIVDYIRKRIDPLETIQSQQAL